MEVNTKRMADRQSLTLEAKRAEKTILKQFLKSF